MVILILLDGCTTWTLTKHMEKKLDNNYTKMLRTVLNKSWRQNCTKQQLYSHQPPITKIIQIRQTRHVGHHWRSKGELISDIVLWTLHMDEPRLNDQLELIYSNSVPIKDVAWKTCWEWRMIGSKRESGKSMLAAWHDDNDALKING